MTEKLEYSACDMATAAADGFRDGVASVRAAPTATAVVVPEPFPPESTPEHGWDKGYETGYNDALDEVARLNPAPVEQSAMAVPEGYVLVPVKPTPAMIDVALKWGTKKSEWEELLAAARAPEPASCKCRTCMDVGIIGHSMLCPECSAPEQPAKE